MMAGSIYIIILMTLFMAQWEIKRRLQMKKSGLDPEVFKNASEPLQKFMHVMNHVLIGVIFLLLICHAMGLKVSFLFSMVSTIDNQLFDHIGFIMGLAGLAIALYSQVKMGLSWRVGIDLSNPSDLVTDGLYSVIRNPTYTGIFILLAGIWLIWPTWSMSLFCLTFYLFLEVQVRCEEEHLQKLRGKVYKEYADKTKRYIPFIY